MNDNDLETQPLLNHSPGLRRHSIVSERSFITTKNHYWRNICLITFSFALTAFMVLFLFSKYVPAENVIQDSIVEISKVDLVSTHIDGWTDDGKNLNDDGGKALQITAKLNFSLDYNKWMLENSTSSLTPFQKNLFQSIGSNVIKKLCIKVNNITTFDGIQSDKNWLGFVYLDEPICVDLHNNTVTELNVKLFLEPDMGHILRVLKKILKKDYSDLNLWSSLSFSLSKRTDSLIKFSLPFASFHRVIIHWDSILNWKGMNAFLTETINELSQISMENFKMSDSDEGFQVHFNTEVGNIMKKLPLIELPQPALLSPIKWDLRLPDCHDNYSINLANVKTFTSELNISDGMNISVTSFIEGSFPNSLLSSVCFSDEENIVTPISRILNNVTSNLTTTAVIKGTLSKGNDKNYIFPDKILQDILDELDFLPVSSNITIDTNNLIENFTIKDMKVRWVKGRLGQKRLSAVGKVMGTINLPFYETTEQRIQVKKIKGTLELFHNEVYFLNIPMKIWYNASSEIMHDQNDNHTLMEITLDIPDDEVEVIDRWEITKVFNEILFEGKSTVHIKADLDLIISSFLGDIILLGLKTENNVIIE
ncbi:hypothetical protein Kpol_385p2 [Vanderwaltozyma polyspora DSM 70294]|uniref:Uncharacterized protein n=1 Tax=Vanderwaltozyma polyspora (strain ATCC 22028 / DSM 70294 / BCRC 21397 / CBS 2163 / NBRC 10782 / NRRL Y-8283 / UCD 57-17) TaxID=436907 RepID=A7TS14_VANPO|nr:uncharacterized protein Kpol_385p2 [Vanderwaltozyma polyspora DSM 70294]EDO14933.1 hypothetical protein Kpol_385p2 [Vanderwaltozyma polyspora DSM 70294]